MLAPKVNQNAGLTLWGCPYPQAPLNQLLQFPRFAILSPNRKGDDSMLTSMNIHSSIAVYVQIENQVRFAIASGKLKPVDQLPSVRELSERLEINPNTVAKSYGEPEVMGLLYTLRGMGV